MKTLTIGLTGGIASGKSAVSQIFEDFGAEVIDADIIAREVVMPNSQGLAQLVDTFGPEILLKNNSLDRSKLRHIVFNDEKKLNQLNNILHPLIQVKIQDQVKNATKAFCIVVIPLLCESRSYQWLDRILLVDVSVETQMKRLMNRDEMTDSMAKKMIESQCTRSQRILIADDVINNEYSLEKLKRQIKTLNSLYLNLK